MFGPSMRSSRVRARISNMTSFEVPRSRKEVTPERSRALRFSSTKGDSSENPYGAPATFECSCRSMSPGIRVWPAMSTSSPATTSTSSSNTTVSIRSPRTTTAPFSAREPSKTIPPVKTTQPSQPTCGRGSAGGIGSSEHPSTAMTSQGKKPLPARSKRFASDGPTANNLIFDLLSDPESPSETA